MTFNKTLDCYSETDMFKNRIYEKEQERQNHDAAIKKAATK